MKKIIILISFLILSCNSDVKSDSPILNFQNELIENEITGSNVFKMVKGGKVIYNEVVNSGKQGDKDINDQTIFPIWSMSKPITTVAIMVLYDRGLFKLQDNLSNTFQNMKM